MRREGEIGTTGRRIQIQQPGERSHPSVTRRADEHRKRGQFEEAIRLCLQEIRARPTYVSARVVLGRSYLESGDHANAEEEFRRVLELSPENIRARVHLSQICESQGRTHDAIRYCEEALNDAPLDREILARLRSLRTSCSNAEASLSGPRTGDTGEPAIGLPASGSPEQAEALFATETLADLYASQGLIDRAAAIYRQLLNKEPLREGLGAKLVAALERQEAAVTPQRPSSTTTQDAHLWEEADAQSAPDELPSTSNGSREPVGIASASPILTAREQMLLSELTRWLEGIRRYQELAPGRP